MDAAPATYPETLDFLYNRLPMFARIGAQAMKKDLTNIRALCKALGDPQGRFKSIHVAGTNGKGSVSHMLAAVLQQAGYKTGLYTSPHLKDFRERIRIDGGMIPEDFVVAFVRTHFDLIDQLRPSFFEVTVAMAFEWFAASGCQVAVVEVGLGGRLDSTNILRPVLSVITNISYDHKDILGDTLPQIAAEKAGIIKAGTPVVIGETQPETRDVFLRKAMECGAPIVFADGEWQVNGERPAGRKKAVSVSALNEQGAPRIYEMELTGGYQTKNLLTVLSAVKLLEKSGLPVGATAVSQGLSSVKELTGLRGRWEMIAEKPLVVADVAHNPAGIREVLHYARSLHAARLHMVTGFVRDKDIDGILDLFPREAAYYFCQADIPRALPVAELAARAAAKGLQGAAYPHAKDALQAARGAAAPDDLVLICGSVFVVAEILP
jgi:dihydrofolate synthase/folylpolyglutamate synthase